MNAWMGFQKLSMSFVTLCNPWFSVYKDILEPSILDLPRPCILHVIDEQIVKYYTYSISKKSRLAYALNMTTNHFNLSKTFY